MKRKNIQNNSGIEICDSIVMSVKKKREDLRKPAAVLIAVIGFVSVIMSFLKMFDFRYHSSTLIAAAVILSAFYITTSVIAKRALWFYGASVIVFVAAAYRKIHQISLGFKFIYNIIYSTSFHTEIKYYKLLDKAMERDAVTTLFVFYMWLLAIVIYFFTICRPNPILPLLVTFPAIEIGLYNGIEISVFWGILTVSYWLALLAMSIIDIGEYSGGNGGFIRKNNLFFPKRQMKLKVTEKCGIFIIAVVIAVSSVTTLVMKVSGYERSDEINQKRRDISEAVNAFSLDNFAESMSNFSNALGFKVDYENHKLGTSGKIKYKNKTDLKVTFDSKIDGAVYLKNYAGDVYGNNEWTDLPDSAYNSEMFSDFKDNGIYPQDFPSIFAKLIDHDTPEHTIWIKSQLKNDRIYAPYGTDNFGDLKYKTDSTVLTKSSSSKETSFKFIYADPSVIAGSLEGISRNVYSASDIKDENWSSTIEEYCAKNGLITYSDFFTVDNEINADQQYLYDNGKVLMAQLLENAYKEFVYSNYLTVPDNDSMQEIKDAYADLISKGSEAVTAAQKLELLNEIRTAISLESTYSLSPGKTPANRDFVNYFLLENHKGYCIHYATSGAVLARMAGIPTRYATGYIIVSSDFSPDTMNSDGTYTIDVKDNRSHAWTEVYLDGFGWVPFEFTAGISSSEINTEPTQVTTETVSTDTAITTTSSTGTRTTRVPQSSRSTSITSAARTSSQAQTTEQATKGGYLGGLGKSGGQELPSSVKVTINILLCAIAAVLIVLLRRLIGLKLREKRFTTGNHSQRIEYIYTYTEKLLAILGMRNEQGKFTDFADQVEERIGGDYFEKGGFMIMTDTALRATFSKIEPTEDELTLSQVTARSLSENIYKRSGVLKKLRIKYIDILI